MNDRDQSAKEALLALAILVTFIWALVLCTSI